MTPTEDLREQVARLLANVAVDSGDPDVPEMPLGFALGDVLVSHIASTLIPLFATRERAAAEKLAVFEQAIRDIRDAVESVDTETTEALQDVLAETVWRIAEPFDTRSAEYTVRAQLEGDEA